MAISSACSRTARTDCSFDVKRRLVMRGGRMPGPRNRPGGGPVERRGERAKDCEAVADHLHMATSFQPLAPALSPEEQRVFDWRYEQLCLLEIDSREARILAGSAVDLDLLRRLVGQGCAPDLAIRIAL